MIKAETAATVEIGVILGFKDDRPLVVFASNPDDGAVPARSLHQLSQNNIGAEVALMFEGGRLDRPLIIGLVQKPIRTEATPVSIQRDEDLPIKITSRKSIELRCGKSSIVMKADGTVTIRGTQILTRAERNNRIQGASVQLN